MSWVAEVLLPWVAERVGLDNPDTRVVAEQAASALVMMEDLRQPAGFLQMVTDIVGQLPGGLGWSGTAVAAPVLDVDAFNRHVALQHRAEQLADESRDPLQLCICTSAQLYSFLSPAVFLPIYSCNCECC